MYGTLRFDSKSDNDTLIQKPVDPACARPVVQQACESCRTKKIKCSGTRPECSRCKVLSKACVYSKWSPRRRSTKVALTRTSTQPHAQKTDETTQAGGSQSQPSPDCNKAQVPSPKLQHGVGSSSKAVVAANTPIMADPDMTSMMAQLTPDFTINQAWLSPLAPPDQLDATSIGTVDFFHNLEDMQTSMTTPVEQWFNTTNAFPSDIAASCLASWTPIPETAHQLPLETTSPRNTGLKRMGPEVLPTPTSSTSSQNVSAAASIQESCSCLQHIVFLVHELETAKMDSLDGQMASHKEAMGYGQAMIVCELCSQKPENLMMLTFLSERLLQLSEGVHRRLAQPKGEKRLAFMFGELTIDSAPEWDLLVSNLAALQLGALGRLLGQLRQSAKTMRADVVYKKIVVTEKLTGELMERLRSTVKVLYE